MSLFLLLYITVAFFLITIGINVFKKYGKYIYGKYFFLFCFSYFIWLVLYLSSFTIAYEKNLLLILSKLMYGLTFISLYFILLFIAYYNNREKNILSKSHIPIIGTIISFFLIIVFSDFIIRDMIYSEELNYYYEDIGSGYKLYTVLCLIVPFLYILFSYYKLKTLNTINKLRFKYIISGLFFLVVNEVFFLVFLPLFNVWILQKEQILFFVPFILLSWYSIKRYHFYDMNFGFGKTIVFLMSMGVSLFSTNVLNIFFYDNSKEVIFFWGLSNNYGIADGIITIILFVIIHTIFTKLLLGNINNEKFYDKIQKIKEQIPFITSINDLNVFLASKFEYNFKIKSAKIHICKKKSNELEIYKFFNKNELNDLFINDIVFIEENKYKFDLEKIEKEISKSTSLILPLRNNNREIIGIFSLGYQAFKDHYNTEIVDYLKDFMSFLEGHLKYLKTYEKINDLNLHLDKKVDEKTIEYNNLINKQKEFIDIISHEIKGPIASTLLQGECVLDDIKAGSYDKKYLIEEIGIMNKELLKTGNLANTLFDISSYDIKKIGLYKEKVDFESLLQFAVERYKRNNENINFKLQLESHIPHINLDKVQFIQVIDNLLANAIKFSNKNQGIIQIKCKQKNNKLVLKVEDNGVGFKEHEIINIFDKYSTGNMSGIGLGMGLYLCKKIVELHEGEIKAYMSKKLGGAKFVIKIPIG